MAPWESWVALSNYRELIGGKCQCYREQRSKRITQSWDRMRCRPTTGRGMVELRRFWAPSRRHSLTARRKLFTMNRLMQLFVIWTVEELRGICVQSGPRRSF